MLSSQAPRTEPRLLTVRSVPGERYRLSALHHGTEYPLNANEVSDFWIGVAGLRDSRDSVDATVVVIDRPPGQVVFVGPVSSQLPTLSRHRAWESRFNLQRPLDALVKVDEGGRYAAELTGDSEAMAELRIEPLFQQIAPGIGSQWQLGGCAPWELNPGLYRLFLRPAAGHSGIARLRFAPLQDNFAIDAEVSDDAVSLDVSNAAAEPNAAGASPAAPLSHGGGRDLATLNTVSRARHRIAIVNDFDNGGGGLVVRSAPLDLDDALPVSQQPDSVRSFPIVARAGGSLLAQREDGQLLSTARSADGPWWEQLDLTPSSLSDLRLLYCELPEIGPLVHPFRQIAGLSSSNDE